MVHTSPVAIPVSIFGPFLAYPLGFCVLIVIANS